MDTKETTINFDEALKKSSFCMHLESDTKEGILEELLDLLVSDGRIPDRAKTLAAVQERESKMSTGMQNGIALPHGKVDDVDGVVTAFALKKEGIDFASLDGAPTKIFIMTISSVNQSGPHIQYLSGISKLLVSRDVIESILQAETPDDILKTLLQ